MHRRRALGSAKGDEPKPLARRGARWSAAAVGLGCMAAAGLAIAEKWTVSASASATEDYSHTSSPNQGQPTDYSATTLTGTVGIQGQGRLTLSCNFSASLVLLSPGGIYATASAAPNGSLASTFEVIDHFFWVDASANIGATYASPYGPQPTNITTPTANRYIYQTYDVSPYIKGVISGSNVTYSVRDDNIWTPSSSYGGSSVKTPTTYANNFDAVASSPLGPWDRSVEYTWTYYDNGLDTGTYLIQVGRGILGYRFDPQLDVSLRAGYEKDRFPGVNTIATTSQGSFYGIGAHWRPQARTDLNGYWEHHFYGSNYNWLLTHRLPNVALSASFTRGLASYPQLALAIPAGITVAQFLDAAFSTRIPDPTQRAQAVAQFLAQTGLPPTLASPVNFYAASVSLTQTESLSAVWAGALNALGFNVFETKNEAVSNTGSALPPALQFTQNYTQTGFGINFSHRLSGYSNLIANATQYWTTPNSSDSSVNNARSKNFNAYVAVTTQFTPRTSGSAGVTYFRFSSPGASDVGSTSTLGIYATVSHTFK